MPSPTAMPADSWPRCCWANNPKYERRATSSPGAQTPKSPHSSFGDSAPTRLQVYPRAPCLPRPRSAPSGFEDALDPRGGAASARRRRRSPPSQPPVAHDAMARDHDRDRVRPESVADGAGGPRTTDPPGDLAVGRRAPERDPRRRAQHVARDPVDQATVDPHVEPHAATGEVLLELPADLVGGARSMRGSAGTGAPRGRPAPGHDPRPRTRPGRARGASRRRTARRSGSAPRATATSSSWSASARSATWAAASRERRSASTRGASRFRSFVVHVISSRSRLVPWYTFARAASSEHPISSAISS